MAPWVKVLATKPENQSSIHRRRERQMNGQVSYTAESPRHIDKVYDSADKNEGVCETLCPSSTPNLAERNSNLAT